MYKPHHISISSISNQPGVEGIGCRAQGIIYENEVKVVITTSITLDIIDQSQSNHKQIQAASITSTISRTWQCNSVLLGIRKCSEVNVASR